MATLDEVRGLIADQLGLDGADVQPHSRIVEDLGAESSDVANIMAAVNDRFGVIVPDDEVAGFRTVSDVYQGVQARG